MKVNPRPTPDTSAPDGIVVIFGAGVRPDGRPSATLRHRVAAAITVGRQLARPLFIPTGAQGRYGDAEAVVMARLLEEAGFAPERIRREETGTDTLSSALAVRRMLQDLPPAPVYACSSAYHLPRCQMLLRIAGVRSQPVAPPGIPAATGTYKRWYWRLRELPAIPYDAALMLWLKARHRL